MSIPFSCHFNIPNGMMELWNNENMDKPNFRIWMHIPGKK